MAQPREVKRLSDLLVLELLVSYINICWNFRLINQKEFGWSKKQDLNLLYRLSYLTLMFRVSSQEMFKVFTVVISL